MTESSMGENRNPKKQQFLMVSNYIFNVSWGLYIYIYIVEKTIAKKQSVGDITYIKIVKPKNSQSF